MKTNSNIKTIAVAALVGFGALAGAANAAAIDTTAIVGYATDALAAIGVVGVAVLSVYYGKKAYVWLRPN